MFGFFLLWRDLKLRAWPYGVHFEVLNETNSKLVDLFLKAINDLLDRVTFEGIVRNRYKNLLEIVCELLELIIFGVLKFFFDFGKGVGVFGDIAEIVDAKFGNIFSE